MIKLTEGHPRLSRREFQVSKLKEVPKPPFHRWLMKRHSCLWLGNRKIIIKK